MLSVVGFPGPRSNFKGFFILNKMGCDIHFHSEVKRHGVWQHHSEANVRRSYALFAKMADVRNWSKSGIVPISEPKGLPEDATELTKLHSEKYGIDGHSHSWLSANEISELHKFIRDQKNPKEWFGEDSWQFEHNNFPYFMGNHMSGFVDYPEDWKDAGIEDVRYVFFFDN